MRKRKASLAMKALPNAVHIDDEYLGAILRRFSAALTVYCAPKRTALAAAGT